MTGMQVAATTGHVTTEGDDIYYEVRGQGPPLLLIAGGGGDAGFFSLVAPLLADEYKVITYDRRANSRSTGHAPQNFEMSQQSRDAVAVLHAVGETSAFVCGNSGGAVIALDMAATQPGAVRAAVVHEPPVTRVHPKGERWRRFFAGVYWLGFRTNTQVAMLWFSLPLGIPLRAFGSVPDDVAERMSKNNEFFIQHELLPFSNYQPDLRRIRRNGVRVVLAAGRTTLARKKFYGQTAPILAGLLRCEFVAFPGHHISYFDLPQEWAATLRGILHSAEGALAA
jgi:pimeloyl-ACP methyl ester carboxylesterase